MTKDRGSGLPLSERLAMYKTMVAIRAFDETARRLLEQGVVGGEVHQYIGEEAVAVGVCSALQPGDVVTGTHRGHGHIIAKGGDLRRMMAELGAKQDGYCAGKGGSMHITSAALGIFGANGIVGAGVPHAVGAAFAAKYRDEDTVAVAFFGDGASNQGVVHEAMNLAAIYHLGVVFVCENNGYAVSFPVSKSTGAAHIADRAVGYGMPGARVDGMDVLAVRAAAEEAIARARNGQPSLVEAETYRYFGHFSSEESLLSHPYRTQEEIDAWRARDAIQAFRAHLLAAGSTEDDLKGIEAGVDEEIQEAIRFMNESPFPEPEAAFRDMYTAYEPSLNLRGW